MRTDELVWTWHARPIRIAVDAIGDGKRVLCLAAPSSISTRREMHPLMRGLAGDFALVAPDWPGFGDLPRPAMRWTPEALSAFLEHIAAPPPFATIAAGHAASYALAGTAGRGGKLVLIAPTWRGPLPTVLGGDRAFLHGLRRAAEFPVIGPALYRLNVNPAVARMMVAGHVYSARKPLSAEERAVMRAPGARFASVAFVTGGLDRFRSREEFLDAARRAGVPILLVYGAETPPKSRAEMAALADVPGVTTVVLPQGKLGVHAEFGADIAGPIREFLLA